MDINFLIKDVLCHESLLLFKKGAIVRPAHNVKWHMELLSLEGMGQKLVLTMILS